jgi:hypothetical protein
VLTSEEEEGIGQDDSATDEESMSAITSEEDLEPIRGKQPCRKKRACADTHADDEVTLPRNLSRRYLLLTRR